MSYEGYSQNLCENNHYFESDAYDSAICHICKTSAKWSNSVDETNGHSEGEIPDHLFANFLISNSENNRTYRMPTTEETQKMRHWRPDRDSYELVPLESMPSEDIEDTSNEFFVEYKNNVDSKELSTEDIVTREEAKCLAVKWLFDERSLTTKEIDRMAIWVNSHVPVCDIFMKEFRDLTNKVEENPRANLEPGVRRLQLARRKKATRRK